MRGLHLRLCQSEHQSGIATPPRTEIVDDRERLEDNIGEALVSMSRAYPWDCHNHPSADFGGVGGFCLKIISK